ncbi:site-specific integrase [Aliivibrio fischeri]|uniref:site-specific integrase n=1 Tax=Aliivibrio fischeri TaxID=668 RepID=UPI0012DAEBE9|nr:site-specific integrase [Aliivibrio fischeri]MUL16272.1 tyrosine-type recombinase/integrase [Aliivibrio fischeri]
MYQVMKCKDDFYFLSDSVTMSPPLLSLRFCEAELYGKSLNYQKYELESLKAFYEFWWLKYGKTLDYTFHTSEYQDIACIIDDLDSFWEYLIAGRTLSNVLQFPLSPNNDTKQRFNTSAARCLSVIRFIKFLIETYITSHYSSQSFKDVIHHQKVLFKNLELTRKKFQRFKNKSKSKENYYRSLTKEQFEDFAKVFTPGISKPNKYNPFISIEIQVRNYVMMFILARYGLRISEALLLQKQSFKPFMKDPNRYLMLVRNLEGNVEKKDTRKNKPSIKNTNSIREIEISKQHYLIIMNVYYNKFRPSDSEHEFVFSSHSKPYAPLSYQAALDEFKACSISFRQHFPQHFDPQYAESISSDITPHWLRHTWAYSALGAFYQANKSKFESNGVISIKGIMEDAIDQLRILGGWSHNSRMPKNYAKLFINQTANNTLLELYNQPSIEDLFLE